MYVIIVNSILERDLGQFREPCRVPVVVQTLQISIARGPEILLDTSGGTQVWGALQPWERAEEEEGGSTRYQHQPPKQSSGGVQTGGTSQDLAARGSILLFMAENISDDSSRSGIS